MQTFILFCYFLGVSFAIECFLGDAEDDHPAINRMAVNCTEGCKYCARFSVKIKNSKIGIANWGCGCGGGDYDIVKPLGDERWSRAFGKTCTETGTKRGENEHGEVELYCCDTDNCIFA